MFRSIVKKSELFLSVCILIVFCHCANEVPDIPTTQCSLLNEMIEHHWIYVDKTLFIHLLRQLPEKHFFLSRPRRFGKSLFIDTLYHYFVGNYALFKDTNIIIKSKSDNWPTYPVVRLDFSELTTTTSDEFERSLILQLIDIADSYEVNFSQTDLTVDACLRRLIMALSKKEGKKVVVLIDEYDSPVTSALERKDQDLADANLATLQNFLSTLKAQKQIEFVFITGVTKLSLTNFFSGYNMVYDISMDPKFAEIVGFTKQELTTKFKEHIERIAKTRGITFNDVLDEMQEWYDGFEFTPLPLRMYNPCSVLNYLKTGEITKYWSETGGSGRYLNYMMSQFSDESLSLLLDHHTSYRKEVLTDTSAQHQPIQQLTVTQRLLSGELDNHLSDYPALICLLFHTGYLSMDGTTENKDIKLRFTNREIEDDYLERVVNIYRHSTEKSNIQLLSTEACEELKNCRWGTFMEKFETFLAHSPYFLNNNVRPCKEAYYHFLLYIMLEIGNLKPAIEEPTFRGRIDIAFSVRNMELLFETKNKANNKNPLDQCQKKYIKKYLHGSKAYVVCFGIVFSSENVDNGISKWGVATYAKNGTLLKQEGVLRLSS